MNNRYLGALLIAPLLIFLFIGGILLKYMVFILSIIGLHEFYKVVKQKQINPFSILGYTLCLVYYLLISKNFNFNTITLLLIVGLFLSLCIPILNIKYNFIDVSITMFGFLYIAVFFSFIVLVNLKEYGNYFVWLIFISSWLCDTSAYYVGRFLGKNKLCPKVSPKKTIEGAIGGLLGSTLACSIYGIFLNGQGIMIPIYHFFALGILCGIFSQFGDLVASSIKRYLGVKDYSNLIPGHGGILDRFDSILFVSVVVYYYITFIIKI